MKVRDPLLQLLLAGLTLFSTSTCAQVVPESNSAPPAKAATPPTAYDAIFVRPHKDALPPHFDSSGPGLSSTTATRTLLMLAFRLTMPMQLSGLPAWGDTERFDIEAKLNPESAAAVERLRGDERVREESVLLQSLLTDRFKMKAHVEMKKMPVYDLVIARSGLKMKAAAPGQRIGWNMGQGYLRGKAVAIPHLLTSLSQLSGRFVNNKTGLTGIYEVDLTWAINNDPDSTASSLSTAMEKQLGLKLEPAKEPVEVIVIDHFERPADN